MKFLYYVLLVEELIILIRYKDGRYIKVIKGILSFYTFALNDNKKSESYLVIYKQKHNKDITSRLYTYLLLEYNLIEI